ncbi:MAG TPA: DmsE family decaheme c-type cytochrome [Bryobacteraceae bacterium]|nr:DmsE family decaheme c-type cytochrome [Bryobacteraceae bacterium]
MFLLRALMACSLLAPAGALAADYVGSNVCKTCHPDVWSNFYKNPHFKSLASGTETPENTGCESCHGPGKAHVEARGGKATIIAFSELGPEKTLDACLRCHGQTISRANIRRSTHTQQDVVCSNCHSIHKSPAPKFLLAKQQTELCYGCHATARAQFSMPFKHRVNEGSVQCTDCHNPHGAFDPTWRMAARPHMVDQREGTEEACLKCHIDKRGPFVFEHGSVAVERCETCHQPHGSMNARLLKRPTVFTLCLQCHNGQGNFGNFGPAFHTGVQKPPSDHNLANPRYQNCTTCHPKIHGSNTSEFFFR